MHVIELIGPSGAGKTTLAESESASADVFASRCEHDRTRCLCRAVPHADVLAWPPEGVRQRLARHLLPYVRPRYERAILAEYPGIFETVADIVRYAKDPQRVLKYLFREIAWYGLHKDRLTDDEVYIADDGLYQFHLRLFGIDGWEPSAILRRLYTPDLLVLVDAPAEVCLSRQESRPRGRASQFEGLDRREAIDRLETMREGARALLEEAQACGIEVDTVTDLQEGEGIIQSVS